MLHLWPLAPSLLNGGERGLNGARFVSDHARMTLRALVSEKKVGMVLVLPATAPFVPI